MPIAFTSKYALALYELITGRINLTRKWQPRPRYAASSRFGERTIDRATSKLLGEINLLGGESVIISTNMKLRRDGLPYSNQPQPQDKGMAVYSNTARGRS